MIKPKWDSKSVGEYERSLKPKVEDDDDIQDYKKPWVGLTQDDVCNKLLADGYDTEAEFMRAVRLLEAAEKILKEKNT